MSTPRSSVRPWLMLMVVAGAVFVLAGFVFFLPLAFQEPQAALPPVARAATPEEARVALGRAAKALRAGDRAAYRAALPASGRAARRSLGELFRHLSPLPWTRFTLIGTPVPGVPGRFDVHAVGQLGDTGPRDRVGGERILELQMLGDRVVATADATPTAVERQFLMAFHDPVAVSRNGLLVLADRRSKDRAEALADAGAAARKRLALIGVEPDASVLVSVYSSMEDLKASLGGGPSEERIRFFSHAGARLAPRPWRIRDIGVLGPSLDDTGAWLPLMLSHEMTHGYTGQWFAKTAHAPTFLLEGLATAVEGGRDWTPLREEVASGNQLWPLLDALGAGRPLDGQLHGGRPPRLSGGRLGDALRPRPLGSRRTAPVRHGGGRLRSQRGGHRQGDPQDVGRRLGRVLRRLEGVRPLAAVSREGLRPRPFASAGTHL